MNTLIASIMNTPTGQELPFSVYSCNRTQKLLNVPIVKPLLVVVLSGNKKLGHQGEINCGAEHFVFLSDSPAISMRNIPRDNAYSALLIDFDYEDFEGIPVNSENKPDHFVGNVTPPLSQCLQQFVESTAWAPKHLWSSRKKEILSLLYHLGYTEVTSMRGKPKISQRIHDLFNEKGFTDMTIRHLCEHLAVSESTLRRKLSIEGTSVQEVKDRARLGLGLHLLQTSDDSISLIAEKCGYHSPSRFTDRFKNLFGLTPRALRKTKMMD